MSELDTDGDLCADDLRAVLAAVREPVIVIRIGDGVIRYVNPAFERLLGYAEVELIGRDIRTFDIHQGPQTMADVHRRLLRDGFIERWECISRTRDGDIRRHVNTCALVTIDGALHGVTTAIDQDDPRAHLLATTQETESRLRFMLDEAPILISLKDSAGRFVYANRLLCDRMGISLDEITGISPADLVRESTARQMADADNKVLTTGATVVVEVEAAQNDGPVLTFRTLKFPLRLGSDEVIGVCSMADDVTDERQAQAALAESEARFRQLAESVDDVFVLHTIDPLDFLYVSPNMGALSGLSAAEVMAEPARFYRRVHPDDRGVLVDQRRRMEEGRARPQVEYRLNHPDGSIRWIRARVHSVGDGSSKRVAVTLSDITEDRAVDLQLQHAREAAEQANRRKNDFLSSMSHELRTPLNAILGFSQLLDMDGLALTDNQRTSVHHIRQAGQHVLDLINELLDISRIESGELRLSFEAISVTDVVDEAIELVRPLAGDRRVTISTDPSSPAGLSTNADRQRLRQVLINLLSNAVKYNRRSGRVTVSWMPDDDCRVRINVADTGTGIADEDLDRLFVPFERLSNAVDVEGTGIGLTLTRQLVEAMGGEIAVDSQLGSGSSFTVWLQADETGCPAPPPLVATPVATKRDASPPSARWTVLYVEDNEANIQLVERLLARIPGCRTIVATHGAGALDVLTRVRPDLVLLDLHLPDMGGDDVLRRLRADAGWADLPVIVISADATPARIARVLADGATEYLTKPFELSHLLSLVEQALIGS